MIKKWLNKENNSKCILFFTGWGTDEKTVNHLKFDDFDICIFYNYSDLEIDFNDLDIYKSVYVVAWSLGVCIASKVLNASGLLIEKALALNGTLKPIDKNTGIHPVIFNTTLNTWNEKNRTKFNMRMLGGRKIYTELKRRIAERDIKAQINELKNIQAVASSGKLVEFNFDCALVGKNDLIFTANNQIKYWKGKSRIVVKDIPHYPFANFETWNEIINL